MMPDSIKSITLPNQIWSMAVDQNSNALFIDTRNEDAKAIDLVRLELVGLSFEVKKANHGWWTQLVVAEAEDICFIEYKDKNDPNDQHCFVINWETGKSTERETLPILDVSIVSPDVYEHGTAHYKTVAEFLSLDLPLSCEYLEWNDKIIISYYLRSGNEFDRHLLLIENGEKKWKVCQDSQMRGFSPGAFFVFRDQLIFIKDRNEVCVYTG